MRRLALLSGLVCAAALVAVGGSALADSGGSGGSKDPAAAITAHDLAAGKPFTTKIKVSSEGGETLALVPVEAGGEKLVFIVDTGASRTQITIKFAEKLKLKKIGKPVEVTGVGCKSKAQKVEIDDWTIAGHPLPDLTIGSSSIAIGKGTPLAGLLGSDVWAKFGSVQVDYANETMTVG